VLALAKRAVSDNDAAYDVECRVGVAALVVDLLALFETHDLCDLRQLCSLVVAKQLMTNTPYRIAWRPRPRGCPVRPYALYQSACAMPRISRPRIEPKFDCDQILAHPEVATSSSPVHSSYFAAK
jgi:hypothetical protein